MLYDASRAEPTSDGNPERRSTQWAGVWSRGSPRGLL